MKRESAAPMSLMMRTSSMGKVGVADGDDVVDDGVVCAMVEIDGCMASARIAKQSVEADARRCAGPLL